MHFLPLVFTSIKPQSHCIKPIELDEISCEGLLPKITDTRGTKDKYSRFKGLSVSNGAFYQVVLPLK